MEEAVFVHVGEALQGLVNDALDLIFRERLGPVLHKLVDVLLHIFKNEVQVIVNSNNFLQLHDLVVIQFAKRFDLTQGHALFPGVKLFLHLLDGDLLLRLNVDGFNDGAVGTVAEGLKNFVPFHYLYCL